MAREMITRDGAELIVETGTGTIKAVEHGTDSNGQPKRNARVVITATHVQLREDVTSWVDTKGLLWPRIQWAQQNGGEIAYRIEVHRLRKISPNIAFADLTNRDKVRDLVGVERPNVNMSQPTDVAVAQNQGPGGQDQPQPAEQPPAGHQDRAYDPRPAERPDTPAEAKLREYDTRLRATDQNPLTDHERLWWHQQLAAAGATKAQAEALEAAYRRSHPKTVEQAADEHQERRAQRHRPSPDGPPLDAWSTPPPDGGMIAETAAGARDPDRVGDRAPAPAPHDDTPPQNGGRQVSRTSGLSQRVLPIASDSKPWDFYNTDGRVNLASYAAGAVTEMSSLASKLIVARLRSRADEDPTLAMTAPTQPIVRALARNLLRMADTVQAQMRSEGDNRGRVDRMSSSHRLCRQAVREGIDLYPVPWGVDEAEREAWMRDVVAYAGVLLGVTLDLLENRKDEPPAAAEAPTPDAAATA